MLLVSSGGGVVGINAKGQHAWDEKLDYMYCPARIVVVGRNALFDNGPNHITPTPTAENVSEWIATSKQQQRVLVRGVSKGQKVASWPWITFGGPLVDLPKGRCLVLRFKDPRNVPKGGSVMWVLQSKNPLTGKATASWSVPELRVGSQLDAQLIDKLRNPSTMWRLVPATDFVCEAYEVRDLDNFDLAPKTRGFRCRLTKSHSNVLTISISSPIRKTIKLKPLPDRG